MTYSEECQAVNRPVLADKEACLRLHSPFSISRSHGNDSVVHGKCLVAATSCADRTWYFLRSRARLELSPEQGILGFPGARQLVQNAQRRFVWYIFNTRGRVWLELFNGQGFLASASKRQSILNVNLSWYFLRGGVQLEVPVAIFASSFCQQRQSAGIYRG